MKRKKTVMGILMIWASMFLSVIPIQAKKSKDYWPKQSDEISAGAAILADVDTGTILYKKNINKKYYPASITKILSVLVAIENSNMDEIVTFSQDAIYKTEGSGIWRDIGEKMTMEQCLYAVMLESSNECAYAVAEHIGGTMQKFVKMMNDKAEELGCKNSNFTNPHGLPDENHYLTAKDMAIIARAAYENETFRLICGTKRYVIPPTNKHSDPTYLINHHKMLYPKDTAEYLYDYCTGGKTGYTIAAGNTLVTYAQKDGMTLLTVILNGTSPQYWNETRSLLEFGFENFNLCNVAEHFGTDDNSEEEKFDTLNTNDPYAQIDPQAKVILPKSVNFNKTTMKISYENLPENSLAQLIYTYGKHRIGTANIIRTNTLIDKASINDNSQIEFSQEINETVNGETAASAEQNQGHSAIQDMSENAESEESDLQNNKFDIISSIKKIDIKSFDFNMLFERIKDFFGGLKENVSLENWVLAAGIILGIILIVIFNVIYNKYYVIRQKIANYRNRKQERKKYVVIRDGWKGRKRKRR